MKKVLMLGIVLLTMWSCDNLNDSSVKLQNYLPMKVGNYWVYQHYRIDSTGVETKLNVFDSIAIMGDTTINNIKYILSYSNEALIQPSNHLLLTRDSSGYLVNYLGKKLFTACNFTDTLSKFTFFDKEMNLLMYTSFTKMEKHEGLVSVPAGKFEVLNSKETIKIFAGIKDGTWKPLNTNEFPVIYDNTYYAPNIGKILDSYQYLSDYKTRYEIRLIRYKIN